MWVTALMAAVSNDHLGWWEQRNNMEAAELLQLVTTAMSAVDAGSVAAVEGAQVRAAASLTT